MFHLDNNSGVSAMPPVGAVQSSAPRWYTEGGGGTPASYPGADWYNIVQAELLNLLSAYGITPNKSDFNQLQKAIEEAIKQKATASSALLAAIAALVTSADKMPYFTGKDKVAMTDLTSFARTLLGRSDAAGVLSDLGLKGAAKCDVGTAAGTVAAGDDSRFGLMIGVGQTWQDVTGSRALSVTYTNSTSRPIMVFVSVTVNATSPSSILSVNGVSVSIAAGSSWPTNFIMRGVLVTIVPAGATYRVDGGYSLSNWSELR